jgi:hypothetical protein
MSNIFDICKVCFTFGKLNFTAMKARFLFPYYFKFIGLILIIAHVFVVALWPYDVSRHDTGLYTPGHIYFLTTLLLMVVGLLLVAFSKEKIEDEQIAQLRLDSLQWALYLNYALMIISLSITRGWAGIEIFRINLWVPLLFFIIRFRWKIFQNNRLIKE